MRLDEWIKQNLQRADRKRKLLLQWLAGQRIDSGGSGVNSGVKAQNEVMAQIMDQNSELISMLQNDDDDDDDDGDYVSG